MKRAHLFFVALSLLIILPDCGGRTTSGPNSSPLKVTSFSPRTEEGRPVLRFQFDKPVIEKEQVGVELSQGPVAFKPEVASVFVWEDRQTLVVRPTGPMRNSTRYEIRLTGDLKTRTGEESFSFVHAPLKVNEVFGLEQHQAHTDFKIGLRFNQEVSSSDLEISCRIENDSNGDLISVLAPSPDLVGEEMILKSSRDLIQGENYLFRCDGLNGVSGDTPLEEAFELSFKTFPAFEILKHDPTGEDHWSDEVDIKIQFSTPVDGASIRKALTTWPKIEGIKKGTLSNDGTTYHAVVDLKSSTSYNIEIAKGLSDAHGQKLTSKHRWTFITGQARPRLLMETGIYAVESKNENGSYPVWTRNLGNYDVDCARVPKNQVVNLLTGSMNYDPWYDAGDNRDLNWKGLGLRKRTKRIKVNEPKDKWHLEQLNFQKACGNKDKKRGGLYLAELRSKQLKLDEDRPWAYRPRQRVLANVTDIGVLMKAGSASGVVWVTSISSGEPLPKAAVDIYSPGGKRIFEGETDKDGILRIPGADKLLHQSGAGDKDDVDEYGYDEYDTWRSRRLITVVSKNGDMAVLDGNWANGIQVWNFGVPSDYRGGEKRYRGFILSDRGIYRPGETAHFKGFIREIALNASPRVPSKRKVEIQVEDSRGSSVLEKTVKISSFGGFSFDVDLGQSASLGDYYVTAHSNGRTFRESFLVEEFRPVTYEVSIDSGKRHSRLGKKLKMELRADYLFGTPVAEAQIDWSVMRRPHHVSFPGYSEYAFSDTAANGWSYWYWNEDEYRGMSFVSDGQGVTDKNGLYRFSIKDEVENLTGPQDYLIQATAQDQTGETISKNTMVTAHKSDIYAGLHAQEWVQAVDMPFAVNTVALTPDGKRTGTKATLSYIRQQQVCKHSGGYRSYSTCETKSTKVWSRRIDIPATGSGTERIMPKQPGEFVIRLETEDSRGNKVAASRYVWVLGKGEAFWSGDESARMSVVASKQVYSPGETAKLAPRSSLGKSTALVTVERNGVLDAFVTRMDSSGRGIEVPITEAHAPNVFASVSMVKGRTGDGDRNRPRFQMGVVELKVTDDHQRLKVEIIPNKDTFEPGEKINGKIKVTSEKGPVEAEVSLSVADEGVLQLIGYKTPDPMKAFYKSWGLGVDNSTNLNRIARLNDPRALDPDEGGDSGDDVGPGVRSRFVSSAFWAPKIVTDANGEGTFEFKAPDNLTAFRMMAVAADAGSKFGSGEKRFTVKKKLMARPLLPRFLSEGDVLMAGVEIRNLTGKDGTATVSAKTLGVRLKNRTESVEVKNDGSTIVRFRATVPSSKRAAFTFDVQLNGEHDAVKITIPVNRPLAIDHKAVSRGRFEGETNIPIHWSENILPKDSRLEITVDRTGMSELEPSLRYLIEYPYGCLEQTLSRLIPLLKVEDMAKSLNLKDLRGAKLKKFIKLGLEKVVRHQHDDGHFSLWPGGRTYPHLTVYALYGLTEAKRAGVKTNEESINRAVSAVRYWSKSNNANSSSAGDRATSAMAAYVLAQLGQPDHGLNSRLFDARSGLPVYGRAFLLMALFEAEGSKERVETLREDLLEDIETKGDLAFAHEEYDGLRRYMSSETRTTAIVLSALVKTDPKNPIIPKLAEGLINKQEPTGAWRSTQDNLYALVALADYARLQADGSLNTTISLNTNVLIEKKIKGHQVLTLSKPLNKLNPGTLSIKVDGPARHSVRLVLASREDRSNPVDHGFKITREYVHPETGKELTSFKVGELIRVKIKVETQEDRVYVAVVDPLPAGFEVVNTNLETSARDHDESTYGYNRWSWRPGWSYTELRDDRVLAFADRMNEGSLELSYLARASSPGKFTAAPARAEAMYEPEINGRTISNKVQVKK